MSGSSRKSAAMRRLGSVMTMAPLLAIAVSGCEHRIPDEVHPGFTDSSKYHRIVVAPERAEIVIPAHEGPLRAAEDEIAVTRVARRYLREGRGPLVVTAPSRAGSRVARIEGILAREGVAPGRIKVVHRSGAAPPGAVLLSYDRIAAIAPPCGDWSEDVTHNPEKLPYPNWGCASQHNLASMVSKPTDLAYPAQETPRGSDRRAVPHKTFVETPPAPTQLQTK